MRHRDTYIAREPERGGTASTSSTLPDGITYRPPNNEADSLGRAIYEAILASQWNMLDPAVSVQNRFDGILNRQKTNLQDARTGSAGENQALADGLDQEDRRRPVRVAAGGDRRRRREAQPMNHSSTRAAKPAKALALSRGGGAQILRSTP